MQLAYFNIFNWIYLTRGLKTLLFTPAYLKMVFCCLLFYCFFIIALLIVMFGWSLQNQVEWLEERMKDGWAWVLGILLVLVEIVLIVLVSFEILFSEIRCRLYITVYKAHCKENPGLVDYMSQETVDSQDQFYNVSRCIKELMNDCCLSSILILIRCIMLLCSIWLNVVPILGNILFSVFNAVIWSWDVHTPLLRAMEAHSIRQQWRVVRSNLGQMQSFGAIAILMEVIPVFGVVFMLSNCCAAALYAAENPLTNPVVPASSKADDFEMEDLNHV